MKTRSATMAVLLAGGIMLLPALGTTARAGVDAVAGKTKLTYSRQETIPVGDVEGHVLQLGQASGPNENTGTWEFMAGGTCSSLSSVDLVKGSGAQTGYFLCEKGADRTVAKYDGTVRTVLTPEGKPRTSFSGSWRFVGCSGRYAGCTGEGVYSGFFESREVSVVEFKGILVQ